MRAGIGEAAARAAKKRSMSTSMALSSEAMTGDAEDPLPPPVESMDGIWSPLEAEGVRQAMKYAMVGSAETVRDGLRAFRDLTGVDELMITGGIFDHDKRLQSFRMAADICRDL